MMNNDKALEKSGGPVQRSVSVPGEGIEIVRRGKPVAGSTQTGHVYLLVDCSVSMRDSKIKQAKSGALKFARAALSKGYDTGLIQFDSSATLLCEPNEDISILEKAIENISIGDRTHIAKAIDKAYDFLKDMSGARVIVLITDGMPNGEGDPKTTIRTADIVKKNGIDIIAIGTDDANKAFLNRLASRTDLAVRTDNVKLEKTIVDAALLLPSGDSKNRKALKQ
ncbi:MAG: VWA domain-containing protein [Dehalococcoidia bacterium]|nr:VWA domain-containing protein [Dehalococcoidia bacterium]